MTGPPVQVRQAAPFFVIIIIILRALWVIAPAILYFFYANDKVKGKLTRVKVEKLSVSRIN
jgi:hypothetical protein